MRKENIISFFLLVQILDVISTYVAIKDFGQSELNPVVRNLFETIGIEATMSIKLIITLFFAFLYYKSHPWLKKSLETSLTVGSIVTWFAAMSNTAIIVASMR